MKTSRQWAVSSRQLGMVLVAAFLFVCVGCGNKQQAAVKPGDPAATQAVAEGPTARPAPKKNVELNKWLNAVDVVVPPTTYRVEPPDAFKVIAPAVKELDKAVVRIRSDGKVSLNLIGDLYVAGLSPTEIAEEIVQRLGKFYNKDSLYVAVEVTDFQSKKYYVFGQVDRPGVKPYTGRDTVIKVLAEAALNDDSWPQKVVLVRPSEDPNVRQKVTIDLKQMYMDGKADQNFLVEEGDLVYVPPSPLAEFRISFEKLMSPILPIADFAIMATTGVPF
jgi:protein involved in polysaccharide export with SLBB domain